MSPKSMTKLGRAAFAAALMLASDPTAGANEATVFTGGRWFDGEAFVERTVVVRSGRLDFVASAPRGMRAVDLGGGYVIPPFCEGHNHDIAAGNPEQRNSAYLRAGVFYVQILNNEPSAARAQLSFWRRPDTVDVSFSHGGMTGVGGHPVEVLEGIRRAGGYGPDAQIADRAYYEVADIAELERKWPLLRAERPDIVKLFLQYSEQYAQRSADSRFYGNRGLAPAVFRRAVRLAHRDGFRVAVHTTSAADFRLAVREGADVIAHVPGYLSVETIGPEDARDAARRSIWVITTASLAQAPSTAGVDRNALRAAQIANLRLLRDAGVRLVVGSDTWGDTSHGEVSYLRSLGVFGDRELLAMWTRNCPQMIFPRRRVGELRPGWEANFIVLAADPLQDFGATRQIRLMVKNGVALEPGPR